MLPIEFVVFGRPATIYSTSSKRRKWELKVAEAAVAKWMSSEPTAEAVMVTIYLFYDATVSGEGKLDADNHLKYTLDGLIDTERRTDLKDKPQHPGICRDDGQVHDLISRTRDVFLEGYTISDTSAVLLQALTRGTDFVYVKVEVAPDPKALNL